MSPGGTNAIHCAAFDFDSIDAVHDATVAATQVFDPELQQIPVCRFCPCWRDQIDFRRKSACERLGDIAKMIASGENLSRPAGLQDLID